jgi:hypothetical protein
MSSLQAGGSFTVNTPGDLADRLDGGHALYDGPRSPVLHLVPRCGFGRRPTITSPHRAGSSVPQGRGRRQDRHVSVRPWGRSLRLAISSQVGFEPLEAHRQGVGSEEVTGGLAPRRLARCRLADTEPGAAESQIASNVPTIHYPPALRRDRQPIQFPHRQPHYVRSSPILGGMSRILLN